MATIPQTRAIRNYRKRLTQRGMARFEVLGLASDRELIRALARCLSDDSPDSIEIRALVHRALSPQPPKGNILAALRRSPMVGAELNLTRPQVARRKVDL